MGSNQWLCKVMCLFPKNFPAFPGGFKPSHKDPDIAWPGQGSTVPVTGRKGYGPKCCRACLIDGGVDGGGCAWEWLMDGGTREQGI